MTKSIKQLRNDLNNLSAEVQDIAEQLKKIYQEYLTSFVEAVGRQLIVATYQICTQKYPESFLRLNYNERIKLQQQLKDLFSLFKGKIGDSLKKVEIENPELNVSFQEAFLQLNQQEINEYSEPETKSKDLTITKNDYQVDLSNNLTPEHLSKLHLAIDNCLEESLNELSRLANNYLQEASILPSQIPAKILEMAVESEEGPVVTNSPPNLLNLLIEKDSSSSQQKKNITQITAICLRVSEIEFIEPNLSNHRTQIRSLMDKIDQLSEVYLRTSKEYAIAEAESAWRASWYEDKQ